MLACVLHFTLNSTNVCSEVRQAAVLSLCRMGEPGVKAARSGWRAISRMQVRKEIRDKLKREGGIEVAGGTGDVRLADYVLAFRILFPALTQVLDNREISTSDTFEYPQTCEKNSRISNISR